MQIIISGEDKKRVKLVEKLAKELGLTISEQESLQSSKNKKAIEALDGLSKINAFKNIEDPVAWQREIRKDRNIGRDE
jgi:hypothetical protein